MIEQEMTSQSSPASGSVDAAARVPLRGLAGLVDATRRYIAEEAGNSKAVVSRLAEDFAYIHLQDVWNPYKFLRQMEGHPPVRLGTEGFRADIVDDTNPARHYIAFVALGFWMPKVVALVMLVGWELAGFVRYGFKWSKEDMASGLLGVRHGNAVRTRGIAVLPDLMEKELSPPTGDDTPRAAG